jgi:hypothetical protein
MRMWGNGEGNDFTVMSDCFVKLTFGRDLAQKKMERETGFEPATLSLEG